MHLLQPFRDQFHFSHLNDLREQAHTYLLRDEIDAAIHACDLALAEFRPGDPASAEIYVCRGRAHYRASDYAAAIADFDRALLVNRHLAEAYANRGLAQYGLGQYEEAVGDLNLAVYYNPRLKAMRAHLLSADLVRTGA